MTTLATNSPTCPRERCGGPLVTYEADSEAATPVGLLRCAGCGRYSDATPEMRAQAEAADAAYEAEQVKPADSLPTPEEMAPRLYAAFAGARGWRDPEGFDMQPWSRMRLEERACWTAVAREAATKYEQIARFAIIDRDAAVLARRLSERRGPC